MLTEAEQVWLKHRKKVYPQCLYCVRDMDTCPSRPIHLGGHIAYSRKGICWDYRGEYSLKPDYKDAAEFETRVARRLAKWTRDFRELGPNFCLLSNIELQCWLNHINCIECAMKHARLAVEEDMEKKDV